MDRRLNVAAVALLVGFFSFIAKPSSAVVNLEFDAAYTVAAPFSTDPVNVFDIEGPPPWLYLDLPDAATSSFIVAAPSDWFREPARDQTILAVKHRVRATRPVLVFADGRRLERDESRRKLACRSEPFIGQLDNHLWRWCGASVGNWKWNDSFHCQFGNTG